MVQCKFRVKIISGYIQNTRLSSLCNVLACQQLLPREEGVGGVGLLPFLLPTLSPTENPCIKGSVRKTRPTNSALNCREFTFYTCQDQVIHQGKRQKQCSTPKTSFTSSFLSVPLFPLHIDHKKWSPYQFYGENL